MSTGIAFAVNPCWPSFALHIETFHFICNAIQLTGFYMKCNTGLNCITLAAVCRLLN